ncbi:MAG: immune inhibitor A, partial [Chloroflexota bacterium]|nr:immune inhibitor A [Chloroflexota bacterium]
RFRASPRVPLIGSMPNNGQFQWYSNRGDLIDSTLTRDLDLRSVRAATLELDLWYDIEADYDYAYIELSDNGGDTWQTLKGDRTTDSNPNGNNLGNGLTGASDGWVTERFDLAKYAGKEVLLRIEYVTDDGYNAQGIAVDGVRVPEIGFVDDSETANGWRAEGWVRTNNYVPGRYRLLVLDPDNGGSYTEIPVGADGQAYATLDQGAGRTPVVIVSGAAATTTQESDYTLEIEPAVAGGLGLVGGRANADQ